MLDRLSEAGLLGARPVDTPMDYTVKLDAAQGEPFHDVGQYWCLVGKLIDLTVARPDITYVVGVVSQYMHAPRRPHFEAVSHLTLFEECPRPRFFVSSLNFLVFSDGN